MIDADLLVEGEDALELLQNLRAVPCVTRGSEEGKITTGLSSCSFRLSDHSRALTWHYSVEDSFHHLVADEGERRQLPRGGLVLIDELRPLLFDRVPRGLDLLVLSSHAGVRK